MRISSLIHVIGVCTRAALSLYSSLRILFHKTNYLICCFPDSGMRRHADKFRQKCQIENSRHTVIKRERIGLNWFKEVSLTCYFDEKRILEHFRLSSC